MQIGRVRVGVDHRFMAVPMAVLLAGRIAGVVCVPVMFAVDVQMLVLHRLVGMLVLVPLAQMQPNTECH